MREITKSKEIKNLWDKKAQNFPRFGEFKDEDNIIFEYFSKDGEIWKDKIVLDLGCGNGRYGLFFATLAKKVYMLDISPKMLENVANDAKKFGFNNIEILCYDWSDFEPKDLNVDIIFTSLTPALNNFENFKKAYTLAKEAMFYVGWGRVRESKILNEVFKSHNNNQVVLPNGAEFVCECLSKMNAKIPEIKYITKEITHKKPLQKAILDISWQLEAHGIKPDLEIIQKIIKDYTKDGITKYTTKMENGLLYIQK